jgi:hypothetical protein
MASPFAQIMATVMAVLVGVIAWWRWRENAATRIPDLPWVARREGVWVLRDWRTRMWCWWNYEEALRTAYNEVSGSPCHSLMDGYVFLSLCPTSSLDHLL